MLKKIQNNIYKIGAGATLGLWAFSAKITSAQFDSPANLKCPDGYTSQEPTGVCVPNQTAGGPLDGIDTITDLILLIIEVALVLAGLIAVLFLIYGGYQYLTAGDDDDKASKGKDTIKNSLIGLAIILLSLVIVRIVINFLNLNI